MAQPEPPQEAGAVAQRISQELGAIYQESYGTPPKTITTYLLPDAVIAVMEIELAQHEQLLVAHGSHASVCEVRSAYQRAIAATFTAAVEHMTGRRVVGFLSDTHLDPPFSVEFFKLAPPHEPDEGPADPEQDQASAEE